MSTTVRRLIEKAARFKQTRGAIAEELGVGPERLSQWQSGARSMPDEKLIALAQMGGQDPKEALGNYHWERAKVGKTLAAVALIASATAALPHHETTLSVGLRLLDTLHIMRSLLLRMLSLRQYFATLDDSRLRGLQHPSG